jgi:hypothetical protein
MGSFDFILDTVSAEHDIAQILGLVGSNGKVRTEGGAWQARLRA